MRSHFSATITPATTIENTRKKYLSGIDTVYRSCRAWWRTQRSSDEYLSNSMIEINPPGNARIASKPPMPMFRSDSPKSRPVSNMPEAKCAISRGKGLVFRRSMARLIAAGMNSAYDAVGDGRGIDGLGELKKRLFEFGSGALSANLVDRAISGDGAGTQQNQVRTDLFNHLEYGRAEKDRFAGVGKPADDVPQNQSHGDIEPGKRII